MRNTRKSTRREVNFQGNYYSITGKYVEFFSNSGGMGTTAKHPNLPECTVAGFTSSKGRNFASCSVYRIQVNHRANFTQSTTTCAHMHSYDTNDRYAVMIYSFYTSLFNQSMCSSGRRVLLNDTVYPFDKDTPASRPLSTAGDVSCVKRQKNNHETTR